jgi:CheY-like chemotaxis protein
VKQHEQFGKTPVILMSGVVNRTVAEKAMTVKADELIRKPFQPQDLILRVKNLLYPKPAASAADDEHAATRASSQALSGLFSPAAAPGNAPFVPSGAVPRPQASAPAAFQRSPELASPSFASTPRPAAPLLGESQKLRNEIRRLEMLVKKLQADLEAGRQYCAALEAHIQTLQDSE